MPKLFFLIYLFSVYYFFLFVHLIKKIQIIGFKIHNVECKGCLLDLVSKGQYSRSKGKISLSILSYPTKRLFSQEG